MVDGGGGGGPQPGPVSKPASTMESAGGRIRFRVELRPDETTIVSWKKLLREANLSDPARPGQSDTGPSCKAQQQPISQAPPPVLMVAPCSSSKQPLENEQKDLQAQPGSNRLSNVIERIERMYAGNGSSDEEDVRMDNVPDDDEYDTEDSFIDDTELDDYFQVDNSAIKHDGFFVNRGELERIEPPTSTSNQPKKRRHKDLTRGHGGSNGHDMNKTVKIGNKGKKASSLLQRSLTSQPHMVAMSNVHGENMRFGASSANASEISSTDKAAGRADPSGLLNGGSISKGMNTAPKRPGGPLPKKWKESNSQDASAQRSKDKGSNVRKSNSGKQPVNVGDVDQLSQKKEKSGLVEKFDLNVPAGRDSLSTPKTVLVQRKEESSVRPKSSTLEKAIRELEKKVAEVRPPSTEVQDPDNSSQTVKRRLPPEVKQKLAKVARIVQQDNYGKIPKDVINRLMGIVGHLMQVRTLKRNLKVLADVGLSAKQEEDKIQKIKQEVAEMVKLRIQHIRSKAEQQAESSSDFQEGGPEENKVLKHKYKMDDVLQNKICDLYDLYVEKVDEDSGPPVRRLYEELVSLWPSGFMDTDGIKRAIYRAKRRRGACSIMKDQDQEVVKKRKVLTPKSEGTTNPTQTCHPSGKLLADAQIAARAPIASATALNLDKSMPGKVPKESSSTSHTEAVLPNSLPKKKVKRKPNAAAQVIEAQPRLKNLVVEERPKQNHKQHVSAPLTKSNLLPAVPPA